MNIFEDNAKKLSFRIVRHFFEEENNLALSYMFFKIIQRYMLSSNLVIKLPQTQF